MLDKKDLLTKEMECIGEFWSQSNYKRLPGKLTYSPRKGIQLIIASSDRSLLINTRIVYGNTIKTGEITLFLQKSSSDYASSFSMHQTMHHCIAVIIGKTFQADQNFDSAFFRFTLIDEFCFPQGFKLDDTVNNESELVAQADDMEISLTKCFSGTLSSPKWIDSGNPRTLTEKKKNQIDKELEKVYSSHGIEFPSSLTDVYYAFNVEFKDDSKSCLADIIKILNSTESLFSLLLLDRIYPTNILIRVETEEGRMSEFPVLYSLYANEQYELQCRSGYVSHHQLLVTKRDIEANFSNIVTAWIQYHSLPTNILTTTLLTHLEAAKNHTQHFILLLASLEQCSIENNMEHKSRTKYQWAIDKYGSKAINRRLIELLGISSEDIGKSLDKLRANIVHPKSKESNGSSNRNSILEDANIANINEMLFVILLIALYEKLGISKEPLLKLKQSFRSFRPIYSKIEL